MRWNGYRHVYKCKRAGWNVEQLGGRGRRVEQLGRGWNVEQLGGRGRRVERLVFERLDLFERLVFEQLVFEQLVFEQLVFGCRGFASVERLRSGMPKVCSVRERRYVHERLL